ncbi:MAG: hypothetical protein DWQ36_19410 [Acidobacteria bacterium]|nr:MAG: hypothetical protein DWQ30_06230 [Acidobacteriota bacterium]REK03711.1 MAG: hypothetical protein DWQ36_19410 [Acidobacteriota bacterium]
MQELLREAGPLFGPVICFGLVALFFAARYSLTLAPSDRAAGVGCTVVTLLTGGVGFLGGARRALGVPREVLEENLLVALIGVKEATSCLTLALLFAVVVAPLLTAGAYRATHGDSDARAAAPARLAT